MAESYKEQELNSEQRKEDHIALAFNAQVFSNQVDDRFYYEPALAGHPADTKLLATQFMGFDFDLPMWVSSMTGGTERAKHINKNLARLCGDYNIGMGLGSCRMLLNSDLYFDDFNVRPFMPGRPLFANLGIAQIEQLVESQSLSLIDKMVTKLQADGLIVHINPMQEWLQPEGDIYTHSPLDLIKILLEKCPFPIIVKEVGQGFGPESLKSLLELPLAAIDFGASGGTNFALLELLRANQTAQENLSPLAYIGHTAHEMVEMVNVLSENTANKCKHVIISGGVKTFLDGYYLTSKCKISSIYAQASSFLKLALGTYEELDAYMQIQIKGLSISKQFLRIKS
ncbi:MAG: isopentenyl-diphosphate delta-isomerase [Saprospiraceae bacterium]|nr:isopentenyl-diphosphate delta-isomerase [Saprospiraceae bacterium]